MLSKEFTSRTIIDDANYTNLIESVGAESLEKRYGGQIDNGIPFGRMFYNAVENNIEIFESTLDIELVFLLEYNIFLISGLKQYGYQ